MSKQNGTVTDMDTSAVFETLRKWINKRPGLDKADYGIAPGQEPNRVRWYEGFHAWQQEMRSISADGTRARKALREAMGLLPANPAILADSFRAFSGRLEWKGDHLSYCTGQYFPTEYRKAAAAVLETYIAAWKQAQNEVSPKTFTYTSMSDVIEANKAIGNHWFDKSSMRFFNTKIESRLIAGKRFITSEKGPDEVRRYTVREALPSGEIDTVGEFQEYRTLEAAKAHVLKEVSHV